MHALPVLALKHAPKLQRVETGGFKATRDGARWSARWEPCLEATADSVESALSSAAELLREHRAQLSRLELHLPKVPPEWVEPLSAAAEGLELQVLMDRPKPRRAERSLWR